MAAKKQVSAHGKTPAQYWAEVDSAGQGRRREPRRQASEEPAEFKRTPAIRRTKKRRYHDRRQG